MKVLIAEDDRISRRFLEATLQKLGYDVVGCDDGAPALDMLAGDAPDAPRLAVLDWMMPGMDGIEVCRRVRKRAVGSYRYLILLTSKADKGDIVEGLDSGADDYLVKPFHSEELRSRLRTGERVLNLERALEGKVSEVEAALEEVRTLQGLLPICMYCKSIRDDSDTWHKIENYISERSGAAFTHSLCNDCLEKHYPGRAKPKPNN